MAFKSNTMDEEVRRGCIEITEALLADENGWPFAEPIDPVRDGCPNYFIVIKKPMDLGTILKKLQSKEYTDFKEFDSDVNLVFSNCRKYNTGRLSKNIRKTATALRALYKKLLSTKGISALPNLSGEKSVWKQCDLCLKWRRIVTKNFKPCRWCCADSGGQYTCETAEEERPLGRVIVDGNTFQAVLDSALISLEKLPSLAYENCYPYEMDLMEKENFWRYLQTCWTCDPSTKPNLSLILSQWESLPITPHQLYQLAKEHHLHWNRIHSSLQQSHSQLTNPTMQQQIETLYKNTIRPYEQGWEQLLESSTTSSTKRPLPTIDDLYNQSGNEDKRIRGNGSCTQCSTPLSNTKDAYQCKLCQHTFCRQCTSCPSPTWLCKSCRNQVQPSWGEFPYCIGCGLDLSEQERSSSSSKICLKCIQCEGLFHRKCVDIPVEDIKQWTCRDCLRLGNLVGSVIPDPTSRVIRWYYTEEKM